MSIPTFEEALLALQERQAQEIKDLRKLYRDIGSGMPPLGEAYCVIGVDGVLLDKESWSRSDKEVSTFRAGNAFTDRRKARSEYQWRKAFYAVLREIRELEDAAGIVRDADNFLPETETTYTFKYVKETNTIKHDILLDTFNSIPELVSTAGIIRAVIENMESSVRDCMRWPKATPV
jgi:hypothetical protein